MKRLLIPSVLAMCLGTSALAATTTESADRNTPRQSTMIVLDGSNSMWGQLQGINKIVTARESLKTLLESAHGSINFGLLTYGNKRKSSCSDLTLVSRPEDYDMVNLLKDVYRMNPRGRSPIAAALEKAASALPPENAHILLVSDGEESCGGDPCAMVKQLRAENPSLQVDVIGFRDEKEAQLECIAENGNGAFVVADNTERLTTLLAGVRAKAQMISKQNQSQNQAQSQPATSSTIDEDGLPGSVEISLNSSDANQPRANYSIYTLDGNNIASFTSRTRVKEYLKPGIYRVKASWKGRDESDTVTILPGKTSQLTFDTGDFAFLTVTAVDGDQQPVAVNYSIYHKDGDFISSHIFQSEIETRIPTGEYRIKADLNGDIQEQLLTVQANAANQYTFKFE